MYIDIEIYKGDDNIFVATCSELNLCSHANTQDEAVEKLKENILYFLENSQVLADAKAEVEFSVKFYSSRNAQIH